MQAHVTLVQIYPAPDGEAAAWVDVVAVSEDGDEDEARVVVAGLTIGEVLAWLDGQGVRTRVG